MPKWLKIVLAIVALLAGIVVTFLVAAWATGYTPMGLIRYLVPYLEFIWKERL